MIFFFNLGKWSSCFNRRCKSSSVYGASKKISRFVHCLNLNSYDYCRTISKERENEIYIVIINLNLNLIESSLRIY